MNLAGILEWSARLAGCDEVPADSQVYVEAPGDVRRVLFSVDVDVAELLLARELGFDAVIAHHPVGEHARLDFGRVVRRQVDQMTAEGVERDAAERAVAQRLEAVQRRDHMSNYNRVVDSARLLGVPLANVHLACDLISRQVIVDLLERHASVHARVADALAWLDEIPEIEGALTRPEQWLGDPGNPLGRTTVAMAGGTNGGHPVFMEYFAAGVDTILAMHVGEDDLQRLRRDAAPGDNLVVTGHMATDSIGINRVIAGLEGLGVSVTRTGGVVSPYGVSVGHG